MNYNEWTFSNCKTTKQNPNLQNSLLSQQRFITSAIKHDKACFKKMIHTRMMSCSLTWRNLPTITILYSLMNSLSWFFLSVYGYIYCFGTSTRHISSYDIAAINIPEKIQLVVVLRNQNAQSPEDFPVESEKLCYTADYFHKCSVNESLTMSPAMFFPFLRLHRACAIQVRLNGLLL